MPDKTTIEWTDATWNPIRGCSRVSEGCRHCYAEPIAARFSGPGQPYAGLGKFVTPAGSTRREARWTGKVALAEHLLEQPLHWRRPRRIFVNSMSDLFHEQVPDAWIDRIFAVMALCPQHTFQILTKRPERMRAYFAETWQVPARPASNFLDVDIPAQPARTEDRWHQINLAIDRLTFGNKLFDQDRFWTRAGELIGRPGRPDHPLPNVWLGISAEDQVTAETRIPYLLKTPAARRFISAEPLLGPIDLRGIITHCPTHDFADGFCVGPCPDRVKLDWVIAGGESGPGARPMHPDWARTLRDQCAAAGVPFFFKQWGEWAPALDRDRDDPDWRADYSNEFASTGDTRWINLAGGEGFHGERLHVMRADGKKSAGRLLDGTTHDGFPA